jgi:2-polyprenyl-3-methyl-5-hydroxy-6-metoxy-1,4-benzoquinol methylase
MSAERIHSFFHHYAGDFDPIYSSNKGLINDLLNGVFRRSMKLRFLRTMERCRPIAGKTVLDVGCGPGHYTISLAQSGAAKVVGIDFAASILGLAHRYASDAGMAHRCEFQTTDLASFTAPERFDYVVVMGFMDYIADSHSAVEKVISLTRHKAFLSFPSARGLLALHRQYRYRNRCDLFLYTPQQLRQLFLPFPEVRAKIEPLARDYFVTLTRQ